MTDQEFQAEVLRRFEQIDQRLDAEFESVRAQYEVLNGKFDSLQGMVVELASNMLTVTEFREAMKQKAEDEKPKGRTFRVT